MHNGNMLRTPSGDLAYIDFGIVSEVPKEVRESMVCALLHLIHGQYTCLAESCVGLALMRPDDVERELPEFSEALREAFEVETAGVANDGRDARDAVDGNNEIIEHGKGFTLIGVAEKLLQLGSRFPFVFNSYFLNNLRCLGMLEGLALNADANFNVLNVVYPFIMKKMLTDPGIVYRSALESVLVDSRGRMRWGLLDQMLVDMQLSDESGGILNAHPQSASALLRWVPHPHSIRPATPPQVEVPLTVNRAQQLFDDFLLSRRGQFVRDYLLEQFAYDTRNLFLHMVPSKRKYVPDRQSSNSFKRMRSIYGRASLQRKIRIWIVFVPRLIVRILVIAIGVLYEAALNLIRKGRRRAQWTAFESSLLIKAKDQETAMKEV